MTNALIVSNILLWVAVLALLATVLALARQIGILYERVAPMGALMMDSGPGVGQSAPVLQLPALGGGAVQIGGSANRNTLLFFLSPTCPVCKKLLPIIKSMQKAEAQSTQIVLASDGELPQHEAFRQRAELEGFPYVLSAELGMNFRVSKLPYAVLLDTQGLVRAKGLVNSREQLESLLAAQELGVASVQEFLQTQTAKAGA
jgi:methylamine dehydrogenase accessory protein MauD